MMTTRFPKRIIARAALLVWCTTACGKAADTPARTALENSGIALPDGKIPAVLVAALDSAALARLELRTGEWRDADAASTFKAYVNDGSVRVIDERMIMADSSTRRVMHYYTGDGHLVSNIETRDQLVMSGDRTPTRQFVLLSMDFVGDSLVKSSKSVNGEQKSIEPFEVDNTKKHSAALLAAAGNASVTTPAKP